MAYIVMAYIIMAGLYIYGLHIVMACRVMTSIVMAYIVMSYIVMTHIFMAYFTHMWATRHDTHIGMHTGHLYAHMYGPSRTLTCCSSSTTATRLKMSEDSLIELGDRASRGPHGPM
jgi:hypothetical protein